MDNMTPCWGIPPRKKFQRHSGASTFFFLLDTPYYQKQGVMLSREPHGIDITTVSSGQLGRMKLSSTCPQGVQGETCSVLLLSDEDQTKTC